MEATLSRSQRGKDLFHSHLAFILCSVCSAVHKVQMRRLRAAATAWRAWRWPSRCFVLLMRTTLARHCNMLLRRTAFATCCCATCCNSQKAGCHTRALACIACTAHRSRLAVNVRDAYCWRLNRLSARVEVNQGRLCVHRGMHLPPPHLVCTTRLRLLRRFVWS